MYHKRPRKADLQQQIYELQKINAELINQKEADQRAKWEKRIPEAIKTAQKALNKIFPGMIYNLLFEHFDSSGYWFTFELINDKVRQTYCVRHIDLVEGE